MNATLVDAETRHARLIANSMRARDVMEVRAGWNREPFEAIREAMSSSHYARTLFVGLEPLCIFGLAPLSILGCGSARIWMFGTAAIDRHRLAFARATKRYLPEVFQHCTLATNLVDMSDTAAMRWLDWLGGTCVLPHQERGGRLFTQFILVDRKPAKVRECLQA